MKIISLITLMITMLIPISGFSEVQFVTAQVQKAGVDSHGASFELSYLDSDKIEQLRWYKAPVAKADKMLAIGVWAFTRGDLVRVELDPNETEESLGARPIVNSMILIYEEPSAQ